MKFKKLKEHKDFEIKIRTTDAGIVASIQCSFCLKNVKLGMKSQMALISNWTRHTANCTGSRQGSGTLKSFFPKCSDQSTSSNSVNVSVVPTFTDDSSFLSPGSPLVEEFQLAANVQDDHPFRLSPPSIRKGEL